MKKVAKLILDRENGPVQIDLSGQPAGVYYVEVMDGKEKQVGKVVKY